MHDIERDVSGPTDARSSGASASSSDSRPTASASASLTIVAVARHGHRVSSSAAGCAVFGNRRPSAHIEAQTATIRGNAQVKRRLRYNRRAFPSSLSRCCMLCRNDDFVFFCGIFIMRSLAVIAALFLSPPSSAAAVCCRSPDETVGWSANKLYTKPREAMNEGSYEKPSNTSKTRVRAIPTDVLPSRRRSTSPTRTGRDNETGFGRLPPATASSKLHPNHPNVDYVYYLQGL